ncbi:MAG: ribosome small subunit-dependent GTPase A [Desulfotomaculales bacterium]
MPSGIVVKAYGGFCYVQAGDGPVLKCLLRGRLRSLGQVLVGDRVTYSLAGTGNGVVEKVQERKNVLRRPPVANVDRAIVVFAWRDPRPSPLLLDRILIQVQTADITPVICFNKSDLGGEETEELIEVYRKAGYQVLATSAKEGTGLTAFREVLRAGVSVLAGPSGVGKSTLLNALEPGLSLKTGEVSARIGRGRHTTRHVELLPLSGGGWVADTPGFTSLQLPPLVREELSYFYPEFQKYMASCQFTGCLHHKEPGCAVKRAVFEEMVIDFRRYENYLKLLAEVVEQEKKRYD